MFYAKEFLSKAGQNVLTQFYNDNGKLLIEEILPSRAHVKRKLYFLNRNLIADTMIRWTSQRSIALQKSDKAVQALIMNAMLNHYRYVSFHQLIKMIERHIDGFEAIIPPRNSRCYPYFKNNIAPILDFCIGQNTYSR